MHGHSPPARFCLSKTKQFLLFKKLYSAAHGHEHTSQSQSQAHSASRENGGRRGVASSISIEGCPTVDQSENSGGALAGGKSLQKHGRKCILAHLNTEGKVGT